MNQYDVNDDDIISYKSKITAAMIYQAFHMIFLIKSNIVQWNKLIFIKPVIAEFRQSSK